MKNARVQQLVMIVAVMVVVYFLFNCMDKSDYSIKEYAAFPGAGPSAAPGEAGNVGMNKGTGLASSLLPREVASDEDFGQFAPEDILKGQNFLEPRQQVGFPETVGGNLRNANQQIRADPPNPKDPFVWNNSTIVPDTMQRGLCA
ncbi:hypothetical protein MPWG_00125 [Micromonas pusilla virus PL1]|jgi:hypothetical protein|nr:hypothetical protein MPWG_00125 [Micromonas pusilla virus PL1]|tara:strand:- start:91 stop:525 length:435 start_codon:yes stop_codon:yes gene_type:complete